MPRETYENNLESIEMFIDSANINFEKSGLWQNLKSKRFNINVTKYSETQPQNILLNENEKLIIFSIVFQKNFKTDDANYRQYHSFDFVKINGQFHFYAFKSN